LVHTLRKIESVETTGRIRPWDRDQYCADQSGPRGRRDLEISDFDVSLPAFNHQPSRKSRRLDRLQIFFNRLQTARGRYGTGTVAPIFLSLEALSTTHLHRRVRRQRLRTVGVIQAVLSRIEFEREQ
jgi:hypothetical protein